MRRLAISILALVSACGGAEATTTTPTTTTTPATTTTTTTTPAGPIEIPDETVLTWDPGSYVASGFWVPVTFDVQDEGWASQGARELWVYLTYVAPERGFFDLDMSILAHSPNAEITGVVSRIESDDEIDVTRPATETSVAGHPALVLDVVGVELPIGGGYCGNNAPGNSRFQDNANGLRLLTDSDSPYYGYAFGVTLCRAARIWVVDVDGTTITIVAATDRPDVFADRIPAAERLVAGLTFDA